MGEKKEPLYTNWLEYCEYVKNKIKNDSPAFAKFMQEAGKYGGPYFDALLYARCFAIKETVTKNDSDHIIVVSGQEGTGKTTLAYQLGSVLDPELNLSKICFTIEQFIQAICDVPRNSVLILDEGNMFLFTREAGTTENRSMVKLFALMRQRNLMVIICIPNFWTVDTYVREHRVNTLINCTTKGDYTIYTGQAVKIVSEQGRRNKNYLGVSAPNGMFWQGHFVKNVPVVGELTWEAYLEKKHAHFTEFIKSLLPSKIKPIDTHLIKVKEIASTHHIRMDKMLRTLKEAEVPITHIGKTKFIKREDHDRIFLQK